MSSRTLLKQALEHWLSAHNLDPQLARIEPPRHREHGHWASPTALSLAKILKRPPLAIAEEIAPVLLAVAGVASVEVAAPGFVNVRLKPASLVQQVRQLVAQGLHAGAAVPNSGPRVLLEYVSANPTGPLHVGHGRGAAFGDALARLLRFAGYRLETEYYVNDAGRQMDILALSTWLRYLQHSRPDLGFVEGGYQGGYVLGLAESLRQTHGAAFERPLPEQLLSAGSDNDERLDRLIVEAKTRLGNEAYALLLAQVLSEQLTECLEDLAEFGVSFDHVFSEQSLYQQGQVEAVFQKLNQAEMLYQKDGAWWLKSSAYGDDKDRVLRRDNGIFTYLAADIAYHLNKQERGFERAINLWGADHHGYLPRLKAALSALGQADDFLQVLFVQFAVLWENGEKVQMSTRSGQFVTLRQLRQSVGHDAARFFYAMRKNDQHLDFDLDMARRQSHDNPVYYLQYAHARIHSVLGQASVQPALDERYLGEASEQQLLASLMMWPEVVSDAAAALAPHQIAFYALELAKDFHSYYAQVRFLDPDNHPQSAARLGLIEAIATVLHNAMTLLAVHAPKQM